MTHNQNKPVAVRTINRRIDAFFTELEHRLETEGLPFDYEYDERETYPELTGLFEEIRTLPATERLSILRRLLTRAETTFQILPLGTRQFEQAIREYGETVWESATDFRSKRPRFDFLLGALDWEMCGHGRVRRALGQALDRSATALDDFRHLVRKLENSVHPETVDWLARWLLELGDDEQYLRVRGENLDTEAQFLELARFWKRKRDEEKYLETLERWIARLPVRYQFAMYEFTQGHSRKRPVVSRLLAEHYERVGDDESRCRVMTVSAQYEGLTLDAYRTIKGLAIKLGTWEARHKPLMFEIARRNARTLAELLLFEGEWDAAARLAYAMQGNERLETFVAERIREHLPERAVEIYRRLIESRSGRRGPGNAAKVAEYVRAVEEIGAAKQAT